MQADPNEVADRFDVFVIGGGGTGSEIAFRLARTTRLRVGLAERDKLGGECNHYGCVPTKVMLRSANIAAIGRDAARFGVRIPSVEVDIHAVRERARAIIASMSGEGAAPFERLGVKVFLQEARLIGEHRIELADGTQVTSDKIVLATGSRATAPPIPGLDDGPYWTNKEAIWTSSPAPSSLAVIGTGAVGIEFAQIFSRFGSRVTAIEALPQILPNEDEDAAASVAEALEAEGIVLCRDVTIESATHDGRMWSLSVDGSDPIRAEALIVATGREPVFDVHDLDAASVDLDESGRPLLTETLRTTNDAIWAAGDATGDLLFTHVGSYEAEIVVNDIRAEPLPRDYRVIPRVTFCDPEVASVGMTEAEARKKGREVGVGISRAVDNERAVIEGRTIGLVKVIADTQTGELLGGHIVGVEAGAMIHEIVALMAGRVPVAVGGSAVHAYPTMSESVKGALQDAATKI
jgi:pyruvate/2-oxoglutarate dehydrogenase complex dihydrolipoamide dehydrogenase (E3) component